MSNSLAIYQQFDQIKGAAISLYKSGFFKDATSEAQAIVKVMAGAELGIPPFASMTGINIIQGKPALGANVMATLVKNDPRYDYRVKQCDNTICVLEWFENGNQVGESAFTLDEAKTAGLTGKDNWKKYTSDMLFARAISRGTRRFAPGVFGGAPVYTPDELGADVDPDGYIDAKVVEVEDPLWQATPADNSIYATVGGSKGLYKDQTVDQLQWSQKGIIGLMQDFGEVTEENADKYAELKLKLDAVEHYIAAKS